MTMRAVVIHAPKDLRIEDHRGAEPGPGQVRVQIAQRRHLRLRPALLPAWRLRRRADAASRWSLGHEIAGMVAAVGDGVTRREARARVAVNPSLPCGTLPLLPGRPAQPLPRHALLRQRDALSPCAGRLSRVHHGLTQAQAVPMLPTAVARGGRVRRAARGVPARRRSRPGPLLGKRVLVTGCGPDRRAAVLVARLAAARPRSSSTDVADAPLAVAQALGADARVQCRDRCRRARSLARRTRALSTCCSRPPAISRRAAHRARRRPARRAPSCSSASAASDAAAQLHCREGNRSSAAPSASIANSRSRCG